MGLLLAIATNTDVTSAARKVVLILGTAVIVKYVPGVEVQGGLMLFLGAVLQAWSRYDDGRVGARAAGDVARLMTGNGPAAESLDQKLNVSGSRVGPMENKP